MKTSVTSIVAGICLASLFSCTTSSVEYTNFSNELKYPLAEGRTDSLGVRIDIDFPEKGNKEFVKNLNSAILTTAFGEPYAEMQTTEAIETWKENLIETYKKDNFEFLQLIGEEEIPAGLNWEAIRIGKEASKTKKFITYSIETYDYTGGAHGIGYEFNMNFEISTGKLLCNEDVFKEGSDEEIGKLLLKHLNDGREGEEQVVLFEDKITPSTNFSLLENGVTFTYNRYDIAAYAYGIIDIFIPAEEIKPYIKIDLK